MSSFKGTWWRPATAIVVLALAVGALSLSGATAAHAGGTDGTVTVSQVEIPQGGSGTVNVVLNPASAGTSVWIIEVSYDPSVAQVAVDSNDNPVCTSLSVQSPFVGAGGCDTKAVSHGATPDTLVILGGAIQNDSGTAKGLTAQTTLATFTFNAVGSQGAHTDLATTVSDFLGPNGQSPTPAVVDGDIDITESAGTSHLWGDTDCNGAVAPRDGQGDLNHFLGKAEITQTPPCPAVGSSVTIDGTSHVWGDWDCNGAVAPRDGQGDLNHFLGKGEISQTPPCPAMGTSVITP